MNELSILILDDEDYIRSTTKRFFIKRSFNVFEAENPSKAFNILEKNSIDIVLLDLKLPEMNGLDVLKNIKADFNNIEVIVITGYDEHDIVTKAMDIGAFDFFFKPIRMFDIKSSIERTKKYITLSNKVHKIEQNYMLISKELEQFSNDIIGESSPMRQILDLANKAALTDDTSVLITGESGTGKELVARLIHHLSTRRESYFYPLNCSAIAESLFENELFGHVKGAFTGALDNKVGCFEAADNGTLFLDEIGDMPLITQQKLLRVLEERKVKKIGSNKQSSFNVRIISATNKNINKLIMENKFRLDLYYRLNTLEIKIPPLRERKDDIPILIDYFIKYFSKKFNKTIKKIEFDAIDILTNYEYPGNVRELKNLIERAMIISDSQILEKSHFNIRKSENGVRKNEQSKILDSLNLEELEKKAIEIALERTKYNQVKAAKLLHISRQALGRKIKKYNLL